MEKMRKQQIAREIKEFNPSISILDSGINIDYLKGLTIGQIKDIYILLDERRCLKNGFK